MIAYFAPGVKASGKAAWEIAAFDRVKSAGPWLCTDGRGPDGETGALIYWDTPPENGRGTWRICPDGLHYWSPRVPPNPESLARRNCPRGIDVLMSTGVLLTIPLAVAAPRKVSLSLCTADEPASEFGVLAYRVFERLAAKEPVGVTDRDVLRLVTLALEAAYRVTPELVDDLGWITTADIDPILCAILGSDPKASNPAGGSSPSPAGA